MAKGLVSDNVRRITSNLLYAPNYNLLYIYIHIYIINYDCKVLLAKAFIICYCTRITYRYMNKFADLGRLWGLLNEGYGRLIELYCALILQKLKFHARYQVSDSNVFL